MNKTKAMIAEIKEFIFEYWGWLIYLLLLIITVTLWLVAFPPNETNLEDKIQAIIRIIGYCTTISLFGFFIGFCLWPHGLEDEKAQKILKTLTTLCVLLFFLTSILLSAFVFVKEDEYQAEVPYEKTATVCYITDTGDCYHKSYCGYLKSKRQISLSEAKSKGYRPCSYCWDDDYTIVYKTETLKHVEHNYTLSYIISFLSYFGVFILITLIFKKKYKRSIRGTNE